MRTFYETAAIVKDTLKNIDFISNSNSLCFENENFIVNKVMEILNPLLPVNILQLENKIWDETSFPDRFEECEYLIDKNFLSVIAWNIQAETLAELKHILKIDINNFIIKQQSINRNLTEKARRELSLLYEEIGFRLFSIQHDLEILKENLKNRAEEEEEEKSHLTNKASAENFYLNPDKKKDFVNELVDMYNKNYFISTDPDYEIAEPNIIFAFENFFETDLMTIYCMPDDDSIENDITLNSNENSLKMNPDTSNNLFPALLLYNQKEKLAQKLKEVFNTETGKSIRLILIALETQDPQLITVGNRKLKQTYNAMKSYFNRDIGTYQSVSNYKYDTVKDKPDLESIQQKLKHCISSCNE